MAEENEENEEMEEEKKTTMKEEEPEESYSEGSSSLINIALGAILLAIVVVVALFVKNWTLTGILSALFILVISGLRLNNQWEESIILRFGKYDRTKLAGLYLIIPVVDSVIKRDMRVRTTTFSAEEALTKDNVPVNVDAVLFWEVKDSKKSVVSIQDYYTSITRAAMTTLRDTIGQTELATLLSDRTTIDKKLEENIDKKAERWGLNVNSVEIREVRIPTALQDAMSRQAQAERERQARIILGDSEIQIAQKFNEASKIYEKNPEAMKLRAMNMLYESIREKGNSIVMIPSDILGSMGYSGVLGVTSLAKEKQEEDKKK
jgi:regulator of protease activity HflC (stomatin/prohibitin superfamily)